MGPWTPGLIHVPLAPSMQPYRPLPPWLTPSPRLQPTCEGVLTHFALGKILLLLVWLRPGRSWASSRDGTMARGGGAIYRVAWHGDW